LLAAVLAAAQGVELKVAEGVALAECLSQQFLFPQERLMV
jgi:hypothetical protein